MTRPSATLGSKEVEEPEETLARWRADGWDAIRPSEIGGDEAWRRNGVYVPVWEVENRLMKSDASAPSETRRNWNGATIFEAVARAWCTPANSGKEFDATLGEAIAREVIAALGGETPLSATPASAGDAPAFALTDVQDAYHEGYQDALDDMKGENP